MSKQPGPRTPSQMMRDFWHAFPLLIIFIGGNLVAFIGALLGHLFW